jgi:hypothetical protein
MRLYALGLFAAATVLAPCVYAEREAPKRKPAAFTSSDGTKLTGTWWQGAAKGAGVILLGDAAGTPWRAALPQLLDHGLSVLAMGARANGAPEAAALDVVAGMAWLSGKGADPARVGVAAVGAECAVALHVPTAFRTLLEQRPPAARAAAGKNQAKALLLLSPTVADGQDLAALAKALPTDLAVTLYLHARDPAPAAESIRAAIAEARGGERALRVRRNPWEPDAKKTLPEGWIVGGELLATAPLAGSYAAAALARDLGAYAAGGLPDGEVDSESSAGGPWTHATALASGSGKSAWAVRIGPRVLVGGVMPAGNRYLELKIRAYGKGVSWKELGSGRIDVKALDKLAYYAVMLEAPTGYVRTKLDRWMPARTGAPEDAEEEDPGEAPGGMPGMPPGMPPMPGGMPGLPKQLPPRPSTPSGSDTSRFEVAFTALDGGGFAFEGEIVLPDIPNVREPMLDLAWGVTDEMPGIPRIPLGGPGMAIAGLDFVGPWTNLATR